jgi:predicted N-acetyltransferase YhbS
MGDVARCHDIDRSTEAQFADAGHPEFVDGGSIPDDAAQRGIEEHRMFVAEIDGLVVGWVFLGRDDGELCIGQISVDRNHQQHGIGSALMRKVIDDATQAGEPTIVLNTQADVAWNQPWYERFGFELVPPDSWTPTMQAIVEEQTAVGLNWSTRVHMRLTLRSSSRLDPLRRAAWPPPLGQGPIRFEVEVLLVRGETVQHCWVDDAPGLKIGALITLADSADPTKQWRVSKIFGRRELVAGIG